MTMTFSFWNMTTDTETSLSKTVTQFDNIPNSAEWISEAPFSLKLNKNYYYPVTTDVNLGINSTVFIGGAYAEHNTDNGLNTQFTRIDNAPELFQLSLKNGATIQAIPTNLGAGDRDPQTPADFGVIWKSYS